MYKWVDEKGRVHFSDQPRAAGAERFEVASVTTMNFPSAQTVSAVPISRQQPTPSQPPKQTVQRQPSDADYRFSVLSGFQKSRDEVVLSGRVEGPACKALRINLAAISQFGNRVRASTVVEDVGFGSKIFKISKRATYSSQTAPPRWNVTEAQAYCAAN